MKVVGYLMMGGALLWAALLSRGDPEPAAAAPAAALLGLGFAAWTTAGVMEGSIRGGNREIERSQTPSTFWAAVAIYYVLAGLMLAGSLVLAQR